MLITFLSFIIGLTGAGLLSAGAWLVSPAAGLVTGGSLCLVWSFLLARSASADNQNAGGE